MGRRGGLNSGVRERGWWIYGGAMRWYGMGTEMVNGHATDIINGDAMNVM